jgi:hypothetical protein
MLMIESTVLLLFHNYEKCIGCLIIVQFILFFLFGTFLL